MADGAQASPAKGLNGNEAPAATAATPIIPRGYLGNLDESQQHAFDEFKSLVEKELGPCDNKWYDDAALIRFLRARRFSPTKALAQIKETDTWRNSIGVDDLFAHFDADELHFARRHYPRWTGRRDRLGRPVYVYRLASLGKERQREIADTPPEREEQRLIVLSEVMIRFMQGVCTHVAQQKQAAHHADGNDFTVAPMSEVTSIIDFDGASIGQMWALRNHLKHATLLATAHYPETLGTMALINTPSIFSMIWGWIQKWFDEGSRQKMFVLGNIGKDAQGQEMSKIIAPADLPRVYGGELDWTYEDEPALDEDLRQAIRRDTLPKGPIEWKDGHMIILGEPRGVMESPDALSAPSAEPRRSDGA